MGFDNKNQNTELMGHHADERFARGRAGRGELACARIRRRRTASGTLGKLRTAEGRAMKRATLKAQDRAQLLQKRLILRKRRNHWQIVSDHLIATPPEDRIGDPAEANRQLDDLACQLAALDRALGTRSRSRKTKPRMVKWSIVIAGRPTNVTLEEAFWCSFEDAADHRGMTLSQLAAELRAARPSGSLSSLIRLFVLGLYRDQLAELQK
jgi:predicted DNA-binding ribbon-helix-helix protein